MNKALAISFAALMLTVASILRPYHNDTATGFALVAILAMWFFLISVLRLRWGESGLEQWRSIRQRGRAYFVLVHGGWWVLFCVFFNGSFDFAAGHAIAFPQVWLLLLIGVLVGPVGHLWEWKRRERRFVEWEKTGPLPPNGLP